MPGSYTHLHFGRQMIYKLPTEIRQIAAAYRPLFEIGLDVPDLLFYYKAPVFNSISQRGCRIHRQPAEYFLFNAIKALPLMDHPQTLAYLLGWIGHFAIDRACHTFVRSEAKKGPFSHATLETALDQEIAKRSGIDLSRRPPVAHVYAALPFASAIASVYPGIRENQIRSALRSMAFFLKLFSSPSKGKEYLLRTGLKLSLCHKKFGGLIVSPRADLSCTAQTEHLIALCEAGVEDAAKLMENFFSFLKGETPLDPRFLDTFNGKSDHGTI